MANHYWSLQPFSLDYGLAFHTTHIVYINFIPEWRDVPLTLNPDDRFFEKPVQGGFIYFESFCQKSVEKKSQKKIFFIFRFDT